MAKSVGNIANEMNKGLTKREASRKAQNERRKLQRRLANEMSKETVEKVSYKEAEKIYESQSKHSVKGRKIYQDIQKLKAQKGGGYTVEISEIQERIEKYYPTKQTQKRKNKMFTNELNVGSRKIADEEQVSNLDKGEIHAFYAATKFAWQGVSVQEDRNQAIMETFGIDDLETIYKLLVNKELSFEDFDFESKEEFEEWLEEIKEFVDIEELREIYQEEMSEVNDVPGEKYNTIAIQNIVTRTSKFKK